MKRRRSWVILSLLVIVCGPGAFAQVKDAADAPKPEAAVETGTTLTAERLRIAERPARSRCPRVGCSRAAAMGGHAPADGPSGTP